MFLIASKMVLCLIIAALIGMVIGYLLCKMCAKCSDDNEQSCTPHESDNSCSHEIKNEVKNPDFGKPKALLKDEVTPDNLKRISGVGEKIEAALNGLGIYTFEQIAQWDKDNIAWVDEYLVFKGRIDRENWVEQAKILSEGNETEFSARFDKKNS